MNQTYYIAWHPEREYLTTTLRRRPDMTEAAIKRVDTFHADWQIKPVRIIEEDEVRELWKRLNEHQSVPELGFDNSDVYMWEKLTQIVESILPEPKATDEKE